MDGHRFQGHVMSDGSGSGRHALLGLGFDLGMASTPIWEYPRREALLAYLRSLMEMMETEEPEHLTGGQWYISS